MLTGFSNLYPVRQDSVEAGGEKYGQDIAGVMGNGPFVVSEWVKGNKVVLKKNDKYWDAKSVKLQTVTLTVIKEEAPRMQMFKAKQIDFSGARGEYKDELVTKANNKEVVYQSGFIPSETYEFFNVNDKSKLFTNKKVRLAFSLAIDREAWVKSVAKRGVPAYGWTPFEVICGDKQYRKEVEEPLKALKDKDPKALFQEGLTELGLDPNATYEIEYLSSGTDTVSRTMAEFMQNQWQTKLGVKIKLDAVNDFPQFSDRIDRLEYQIAGMGWTGDFNEPMTFFDMFTTGNGNNPGKWSNKEYDELIKKAMAEMDPVKRMEIYKQCEQILVVDDCAIAPTLYRDKNLFTQNYVKGLEFPLFGQDYEFKYAYTEGRE
jgi:oligopeptide transport system substrate-binding protein